MIICPKCGKENQAHYKFCLGCGSELPRDGGGGGARPLHPTPPAGVPAVNSAKPAAAPPVNPFGAPTASAPPGPPGPPGPFGASGPAASANPFGASSPPPQPFSAPVVPPNPFGAPAVPPNPFGAPPPASPFGAPGPAAVVAGSGPRFQAVCPQCSSPNAANKRYCLTCGADLTDHSAPSTAPQSFAPVAPPVAVAPVAPPASVAPTASVAAVSPVAAASAVKLLLIRPDGSEGGSFSLAEGTHPIGRSTDALFSGDAYLSPQHASFTVRGRSVSVRDEGSLNGVYLRVAPQVPVDLLSGDVFRVGQEILRFDGYGPVGVESDGTERQGAQIEGLVGRISLVLGRETTGNAFPVPATGLFLGRERGDILFPEDGYVSGLHAQLTWDGAKLSITDLNSSNGTYIRLRGERALQANDLLLMGQQLFRVVIA
jgi:pSer/pThr/pTyr-binding forkhead associated (FHA) protein